MSNLGDLYQEVILEHSKAPRNYRVLENANRKAEGFNPLCGDHFTIYLKLNGDVIEDVTFQGSGCAISKASGSMMTQSIKGKKIAEVEQLFEQFHKLVTGQPAADDAKPLGKLDVFCGVSEYPVRVKCATLAWHALRGALAGDDATVSTE